MMFFRLRHTVSTVALITYSWVTSATPLIPANSHLTVSSSKLTDHTFVFQAGFNPGSLKKTRIAQQTDGNLELSTNEEWEAGALLTKQLPEKRVIATYNYVNKQTVPFEWEQLPIDIQKLFNTTPNIENGVTNNATSNLTHDKLGPKRVSYLRGESAAEGPSSPSFRVRKSVLGDIVHSTPTYVGAPSKNVIGANYAAFYEQHKNRSGTIFVSANDGMLHAFSAQTGVELFAYIPSPLLKQLPQLTDPAYQATNTMDGNLQVAEAQVAGQWKTVLAAGMGRGGKGVFVLDVTAPEQFMAGQRRLFEFTEEDDPDIGYITAAPLITKIMLKKNKKSVATEKYFIIISSGSQSANPHGEQFLFLLSLDKSPAMPWLQNNNYYKIRMKAGSSTNAVNALSAPGLALNQQGAAIYAYSGDLQGNVWRFDFSHGDPAAVTPKVIFAAQDKQHNPQAITTAPVVAFGPDHGYLVLVGTGNTENPLEKTHPQNSFYAIHDSPKTDRAADESVIKRSQLAARELITSANAFKISGKDFSYDKSQSAAQGWRGWYIDYPNHTENCEESSLSEGVLAYGMVFFNTTHTCWSDQKEISTHKISTNRSYQVNVMTGKLNAGDQLTGFSSSIPLTGKPILLSTSTLTANKDVNKDVFGRRYYTEQYSVLNFAKGMTPSKVTLKAGRLSWREITNWQDLKNQ